MVDISEMSKGIPCNIYCLQWDLYKNENSVASARVLHELGGKRDHERVIWTCLRFGRAINSVRKLHPKGPNRSKYKTMSRIAYYALKMQVRRGEYKVLAITSSIWHRHFRLIYMHSHARLKKRTMKYTYFMYDKVMFILLSV